MTDTLPPGSEDEQLLDLLHGMRANPTAAALIEAVTELGGLRLDWARQAATIQAQAVRITRLQEVIARLSKSLAAEREAAALPPPAPGPGAAG